MNYFLADMLDRSEKRTCSYCGDCLIAFIDRVSKRIRGKCPRCSSIFNDPVWNEYPYDDGDYLYSYPPMIRKPGFYSWILDMIMPTKPRFSKKVRKL